MNKEKKYLCELIDRFENKRIAVWGDFILDEYIYGNTNRVSREAPVLILSYKKREFSLGGGGNALLNLKALGASPFPIGVIGSDSAGDEVIRILKSKGIPTDFLIREKSFSTPAKIRILAGEENTRKQQILRIDKEGRVPDKSNIRKKLGEHLLYAQKKANALLISDYNYFNVKENIYKKILPGFKKAKIPVAVDSRFRMLSFKQSTVSTPNEPEVEDALKIHLSDKKNQLKETGSRLLKKTDSEAILLTRGSKGMVLFEKEKPPVYIPVHGTTDIVDVTGAGDTVISVFTLALTAGGTFVQAASLANYAGGMVVMKKGTATVGCKKLKEAVVS
jgi:rfaE bifunctional protein kinase chain/domain